jgi:hypothetical protein
MLPLTLAISPCIPFAAPMEGRGRLIPSADRRFQRRNDLLGSLRILPGQRTTHHNALHRFRHDPPSGV